LAGQGAEGEEEVEKVESERDYARTTSNSYKPQPTVATAAAAPPLHRFLHKDQKTNGLSGKKPTVCVRAARTNFFFLPTKPHEWSVYLFVCRTFGLFAHSLMFFSLTITHPSLKNTLLYLLSTRCSHFCCCPTLLLSILVIDVFINHLPHAARKRNFPLFVDL